MKTFVNWLSRYTWNRSLGLLLIRVATGLVFFMHGWSKINNIGGTEAMFVHMGLGSGTGLFIAWLEVIGGVGLILGIFTRVFAVAFGIEMFVAITIGHGWGGAYQPHELELLLMLLSFGLALTGSGRVSLWSMDCDKCGGMLCEIHGKK